MARANPTARALRRDLTDAERLIWCRLRNRGLYGHKFRRQHPVGPYVVDFVCIEERLVVEIDGGQHAEQAARDEMRSVFLKAKGYRVLRFWNNEVMANIEGVLAAIAAALGQR